MTCGGGAFFAPSLLERLFSPLWQPSPSPASSREHPLKSISAATAVFPPPLAQLAPLPRPPFSRQIAWKWREKRHPSAPARLTANQNPRWRYIRPSHSASALRSRRRGWIIGLERKQRSCGACAVLDGKLRNVVSCILNVTKWGAGGEKWKNERGARRGKVNADKSGVHK